MENNKTSILIRKNLAQINLLEANFKYIDFGDLSENDFEKSDIRMQITDDYEIKNFNNEEVVISFERNIFFDPEVLYKISVVFEIIYNISENMGREINGDILNEELEEKSNILLSPVLKRASLLISNITNVDDDLCLISPPFLKKSNES